MTTFDLVDLPLIVASRTNPRKTFNTAKLTELAESIAATGVHQPILLRPLPGSRVEETSWCSEPGQQLQRREVRPTYELVCGERRYRASLLAKQATIPAMIRELTDDAVLEIQIIENLQRDDLTALEEAEGYEALMQHTGLNADAVGLKIGKSRSYVFGRLKLLDLSQDSKQALRDGLIDASRALLIARVPDSALQAKAVAEATRKDGFEEVPSVRELQRWLQNNVMLRLDRASFNITDLRLVKEAGSCKTCPKRTGASPDLFADVSDADICTDPACFKAKEAAHHDTIAARAESKGMRLIEGKEAKQICHWNGKLNGYLPLSQVREDATHLVGTMATGMKAPTLRELLGKDGPKAVLIENPSTKELIEAVPAEEAEAALVSKGLIKLTTTQANKLEETTSEIDYLKGQMDVKVARAQRIAVYEAVLDGIRGTPDHQVAKLLVGDVLREWLLSQMRMHDDEDMARMLGYTFIDGEDENDGLVMHIRACSEATLMRALVTMMAMEDAPGHYARDEDPTILKALSKPLALDIAAVEKAAKAEVKAEVTQQIKALQREAESLTALANTPLTSTAEATKGKGGKTSAKPKASPDKAPARKPKLNAEQAITGIAAAMQSAEEDQAATALPDAPATGLVEGAIVRVHPDLTGMVKKWAGKEGKITKVMPDDCYQVKLVKGPSMPFYGSQIAAAA